MFCYIFRRSSSPYGEGGEINVLCLRIYNKRVNKYYVGQTEDVDIRLRQHNEHTFKSYTSRFPGRWELIHTESLPTRSEALKREKGLKSGTGREYIKSIIPASSSPYFAVRRRR